MSSEPDHTTGDDPRMPAGESGDPDARFLPADSDRDPTLSVVLPTLDEEAGIRECIREVRTAVEQLDVPAELIVSDSSTDRTPEIAREMGAIVVEPDRPGYGYAYRYAFEFVRGQYVAIGDADTTYDFTQLPSLYERVAAGDADIAIGSRLAGTIEPGAMPTLHRYVGNPVLTRFLNAFYDAGVSDAHSGFRVLSRRALEDLELQSDGMELASEMIMDATAKGLAIAEEPITYRERTGDPTIESFRDGWRHVKFMLVNAPGYLFSVPGLVMVAAGVTAMVLALAGVELAGAPLGERTMIAGSLLTIVGLQATSLGVFSVAASDPIRAPDDPVTRRIASVVTLERGALAGTVLFTAGVVHATLILLQWVTAGYELLPALMVDIAAYTAIVVGIQTVFAAFFLSAVADAEFQYTGAVDDPSRDVERD